MKTVERLAGRALLAWIVGSFLLSAVIPHEAWATPMVAITRPAPGAVVTAEVWVDVVYQSSSSDPIVRLELLVDEAVVRQHVLPSPRLKGEASFSYTFQTEAGELHRLSVRAIDSRGAIGEASINVQVRKVSAPPSQDQVPPVVNIYYPHEGEQVSGNVEIKVDARDNVGVEWVFIYLDGKIKAMIKGAPPYIDRWDTTKTSDGVHVLQAKAWDAAENQGSSAPVQVAVANRNRTLPQSPSGEAPVPLTGTVPAGPEPGRAPTAPEAAQRQPSEREPAPAQGLVPTSGAQSTARAGVVPPAPVRTVGRPEESGTAKASGQSVSPATVAAAREYSGAPVAQASTVARTASTTGARIAALSGSPPRATAYGAAQAAGPALLAAVSSDALSSSSARVAPSGALTVGRMIASRPARGSVRAPAVGGGASSLAVAPGAAAPQALSLRPQFARSGVDVAYRVGAPAAGSLARTVVPALLQAGRPEARALPGAARLRQRSVSTGEAVNGVPAMPARLAAARPQVAPEPDEAALRPSSTRGTTEGSRSSRPGPRTAMAPVLAPRPKASAAEAVPELVPRAAEVYLLAMLPHASVGRLGGQKSSTPGAAARQVELIDISPAALSKFRDVRIVYDGKLIPLRACPEVSHGIPVGPLREIFEQCDGVLYWFPVQKQVRAVRPGLTLELQIGVPTVKINDGTEQLELAPYIRHGRTMVPLSFLARTLNLNITFDSKRGQLIISRSDM